MMSSLSSLLLLACPLGMAAMMAMPALWHRLIRRAKPAEPEARRRGLSSAVARG